MYKKVLVPLDGSKLAEAVLPAVTQIATGLKARVTLFGVVEEDIVAAIANPMQGRYVDQVGSTALTVARDYLKGVSRRLGLPEDQVQCTAKVAAVSEAIVEEAERDGATLIAMSTHGRSGAGRWLLGSVADKVLHAASAPLLLYRPRADRRQGAEFSTIVVPLDGSPMAETVLPHAEALAGAMGLGVHLIRVTSTLIEYYAGEGFYTYPGDLIAEMDREALRYLEAKSAELKKRGVRKVTTQHLTGAVAIQIVDAVKNLPGSLVAISSHGRSGVGRWVLGSVADRVVSGAGSPVLVVRP